MVLIFFFNYNLNILFYVPIYLCVNFLGGDKFDKHHCCFADNRPDCVWIEDVKFLKTSKNRFLDDPKTRHGERSLVHQWTDACPQTLQFNPKSQWTHRLVLSWLVVSPPGPRREREQSTQFLSGAVNSHASAQMAGNYHQNLPSAAEVRGSRRKRADHVDFQSPAVGCGAVF